MHSHLLSSVVTSLLLDSRYASPSLAISGYCTSLIDFGVLYTVIFYLILEPLMVHEASFDFTIISFTSPSSQSMSESCISTLDTLAIRILTLLCELRTFHLKFCLLYTLILSSKTGCWKRCKVKNHKKHSCAQLLFQQHKSLIGFIAVIIGVTWRHNAAKVV